VQLRATDDDKIREEQAPPGHALNKIALDRRRDSPQRARGRAAQSANWRLGLETGGSPESELVGGATERSVV
jgi:hypothetical protein